MGSLVLFLFSFFLPFFFFLPLLILPLGLVVERSVEGGHLARAWWKHFRARARGESPLCRGGWVAMVRKGSDPREIAE